MVNSTPKKIAEYSDPKPQNNQSRVNPQNKINTIMFKPAAESHIIINEDKCKTCSHRTCLTICPAGMFSLSGDGSQVIYSHEGCLECGTCYIICPDLTWEYPPGGYGVIYRES